MWRRLLLTTTLVLTVCLTACGGESARSAQAYCDTVAKYKDRYLAAMDQANSSGGLTGLLTGVSAIGDIKNMWVDLAKVAPNEIQTDTEAVRDAWEQSEVAAEHGDYLGLLTNAFTNSGPAERVNDYIVENCGAEYAP